MCLQHEPAIQEIDYEVWEPWLPKVGQQVRFKGSNECICLTCGGPGHTNENIGRIVTVKEVPTRSPISFSRVCGHIGGLRNHRIVVSTPHEGGLSVCAAIELEPLEIP